MRLMRSIAIAFSMFSAVPMPQVVWDKASMRYALLAFPLVGCLIGLLIWGWVSLCSALAISPLVRALGLTLLPVVVTGGLHIDGFCDTWDALSSRREPERMYEILKDPHIGAFGVLHLALLLLATFVLWAELPTVPIWPVALGFVLSRSLCALAVASFPLRPGAGLARAFAEGADRRLVAWGSGAIAVMVSVLMCLAGAWGMVAVAGVVFALYRLVIVRRFGGLSGDLSGWLVQTVELWMLVGLYAMQVMGVVA